MSDQLSGESSILQPRLSIVVPAYNEERRIVSTLQRMSDYFNSKSDPYEILVVDDGSSDKTREIVTKFTQTNRKIQLLHYDGNKGKGYAVRYGMMQASGDFILFTDADLATPIEEFEKLMQALDGGCDIAIGSRDIPGAKLERRQSFIREMGGKLFNRCVQIIAVPGIHDTQCGFKLFHRAAARNIFSRCQIDNFSFDVEALYIARLLGYSIQEVPVRWAHQAGSKVRFVRDAIRMLKTLFRIRLTNYDIKQASVKHTTTP